MLETLETIRALTRAILDNFLFQSLFFVSAVAFGVSRIVRFFRSRKKTETSSPDEAAKRRVREDLQKKFKFFR